MGKKCAEACSFIKKFHTVILGCLFIGSTTIVTKYPIANIQDGRENNTFQK